MTNTFSKYARLWTWAVIASLVVSTLPMPVAAQMPPDAAEEAPVPRMRTARVPGAGTTSPVPAARRTDSSRPDDDAGGKFSLAKDAPLDSLLETYSRITGRTMIKAPGVAATLPGGINVEQRLTKDEMIQVMDAILTMNNIALVPLGERFYRVVPIEKAPTEGMVLSRDIPADGFEESDALLSQLITLKHLDLEDAVNIIQPMMHGYGKVQKLERINSLVVQETATNLRRIYEILEMVDQPTEMKVETRIYEIQHAKASDIASRLNELVSDSQNEQRQQVPQVAQPVRRQPNMIRAQQPRGEAAAAPADNTSDREAAMAEQGIVQGKVKVLTDERTNIIIVISRPSNFIFFDKIVAVLDRPVDPEVIVKVISLEYAEAEKVSGLLNEFIGAAKSESDTGPRLGTDTGTDSSASRARALEDYVRSRAAATDRLRQAGGDAAVSKIGQLSPNTKILADDRTNTLLLMGTKGDIAALEGVIAQVDIMQAQVLIEAVILEVNINNDSAHGVGWLQKSMTAYNQRTVNNMNIREPVASWGGSFGGQSFAAAAGDTITRAFTGDSGLSYFFTFNDLNIDMVLNMVAASGEGRVLATPVVTTTDGEEASIMSGQQIPIRTGDSSSGGTWYSDYEYKDVGIQLKVKPRINPSRYVTLEITQAADTLGSPVDVGNSGTMTSINKREMTAKISIPSRSTIVLGGLVQTDYQSTSARVPILGSIPLLGALFRSETKNRQRTELLVLITPYVLMTPEEARAETMRLHRASNVSAEDWYRGWSDSDLARSGAPGRTKQSASGSSIPFKTVDGEEGDADSPPVYLVDPAATGVKPTPDAIPASEFNRELEERMRSTGSEAWAPDHVLPSLETPLPPPAEPATTAPFTFDTTGFSEPEESHALFDVRPPTEKESPPKNVKSKRTLFGRATLPEAEENKPSMMAAPVNVP